MQRYGRGLNREIVSAVNLEIIEEPFSVGQVKAFTKRAVRVRSTLFTGYESWQ
jgi:hypothetical protein